MKRSVLDRKRYSERTGKLHMLCPFRDKTGIDICVVIRDGQCYRSGECMVIECRYNSIQSDLKNVLSVIW